MGSTPPPCWLVAAGDPGRPRSEVAFAHLGRVAALEASSAKVARHRLNRGGERQAEHALGRIIITRLAGDPRTKAYAEPG